MTDDSAETAVSTGTSGDVETELSRDMSLFDITFIGVGAMIGAGVFALTGSGPACSL